MDHLLCQVDTCRAPATWTHVSPDGTERSLCAEHAETRAKIDRDQTTWTPEACDRLLTAVFPDPAYREDAVKRLAQRAFDDRFAAIVNFNEVDGS